jgi:hypothetical protein
MLKPEYRMPLYWENSNVPGQYLKEIVPQTSIYRTSEMNIMP